MDSPGVAAGKTRCIQWRCGNHMHRPRVYRGGAAATWIDQVQTEEVFRRNLFGEVQDPLAVTPETLLSKRLRAVRGHVEDKCGTVSAPGWTPDDKTDGSKIIIKYCNRIKWKTCK